MNEVQEAALAAITALVDEVVNLSGHYGVQIQKDTVVRIEQFAWATNVAGADQVFLNKVAAQAARLHGLVAA